VSIYCTNTTLAHETRLSLSIDSPAALIFTAVTNLLLLGELYQLKTHNIKGKYSALAGVTALIDSLVTNFSTSRHITITPPCLNISF